MKRIALAVASLFLLAGTLAAKPKEEVTLAIVLEKAEYKLSDKIETGFKLVNSGKGPVWVNKRFKLGSEKAAPDQRELILGVKAAGGPVEMKVIEPKPAR